MNGNLLSLNPEAHRARGSTKSSEVLHDSPTVLVIYQDEMRRKELEHFLKTSKETKHFQILSAPNLKEARVILLGSHPVHSIFLEPTLGFTGDHFDSVNFDAILELQEINPHLRIVTWDMGEPFLAHGSEPDHLRNAFNTEIVPWIKSSTVAGALAIQPVRKNVTDVTGLAGNSPAMRSYLESLQSVAVMEPPVLIEGETGSGKSQGARWIHNYRKLHLKKDGPLIEVNLGAIPDSLVESELFGHEKGAFTGAHKTKIGQFEAAQGGTLFLDEIGDASLALQQKLLKVIDEKKLTRIGGHISKRFDAKIICATNRNLQEMVKAGTFREDLFYRINPLYVRCPSLEDRKEDIPEIVRQLLPEICNESGLSLSYDDLPKEFIQYLMTCPMTGNIRGLKQKLLRLITFAPRSPNGKPILHNWKKNPALQFEIKSAQGMNPPATYEQLMSIPLDLFGGSFPGLKPAINAIRTRFISSALERYGDVERAAKALKIPASTLYGHRRTLKNRQ